MDFGTTIIQIIDSANDFLWTYIVITLLVACALYFSFRTRFVQFTMLGEMLRVMLGRDRKPGKASTSDVDKIGSFQAFAVALSSRVGTGNLAGVACAILAGGPGAVFWMWVMALLGSATAFVEATLAQLYKRRGEESYYGGPAYYMETGLKKRWMGVLFAVLMVTTFGFANQIVQSRTIVDALHDSFGWSELMIGVVGTTLSMAIIVGGIKRISHFTSIIVPFMALGFILLALTIVCMNITQLPHIISLIVGDALGMRQVGGGMLGAAVLQGVKRGLFSNEAGEGSAPNAAAIASTSHPVKQGLIQALGVFCDTIVICTCTSFIIIFSGLYTEGFDGIILTARAVETEVGFAGRYFITAAIFLFAFSTLIANYFYGETNIRFITPRSWAVWAFRALTAVCILSGSILSLQTAWSLVDVAMGLMTLLNLVAISLLSNRVFRLLRDYRHQKQEGKEPEFHKNEVGMAAENIECWE